MATSPVTPPPPHPHPISHSLHLQGHPSAQAQGLPTNPQEWRSWPSLTAPAPLRGPRLDAWDPHGEEGSLCPAQVSAQREWTRACGRGPGTGPASWRGPGDEGGSRPLQSGCTSVLSAVEPRQGPGWSWGKTCGGPHLHVWVPGPQRC